MRGLFLRGVKGLKTPEEGLILLVNKLQLQQRRLWFSNVYRNKKVQHDRTMHILKSFNSCMSRSWLLTKGALTNRFHKSHIKRYKKCRIPQLVSFCIPFYINRERWISELHKCVLKSRDLDQVEKWVLLFWQALVRAVCRFFNKTCWIYFCIF